MPRSKRLPVVVLLLALAANPVSAQVAGHPVEVAGGGGIMHFDARDHIETGTLGVASIGYRWSPALTFEAAWLGALAKRDATYNGVDHEFSWLGADLRWNLRDPSEKFTPYLLTGFGFGRSHTPELLYSGAGAAAVGAGVIMNLMGNERAALRLQLRNVFMQEANTDQTSNHIAVSAAFQYTFRGKSKDQDLDGVRNWLDECPNTPVGAKVDAKGCPLDSDGDGVFDGLDQCENTFKGAVVDAKGCPMDADGDGVADGIDQCPNTPAGLRVESNGCPIEVSEKEIQLLDTGVIRLQNINFDVNKATIKAESFPLLDEVAAILLQYPTLQLEIGGHTDNTGKKAANVKLSEARAKSVLNYLMQKFPTLDGSHFTSVGYGPEVPVASNTTSLGRAKNRRVEFRVTNAAELKTEREKRRFLRKDEDVPVPKK